MPRRSLSYEEKRDWLRLSRTATIGPIAFRDLIRRYGDAGEALAALPELAARGGRKGKLSIPHVELVEAEMEQTEDIGAKLIASCEPDFPHLLANIDPPPPIITVRGHLEQLHGPCVAIVGSRNASAMGLRFARQIAHELGDAGFCIVSGLARGIDAQAHGGALSTGTAAVLGGGVDQIYPRQNEELYHEIAEHGVIVSESPLGHVAQAKDFPRRNRIISGLSLGIVVVEAAERSGTLITARYALEQGREVMAAPGSPLDPRVKGCNRLIRQGAALIENAEDIIDLLEPLKNREVTEDESEFRGYPDTRAEEAEIDKARDVIMSLCSPTPAPRDEIIRLSGFPVNVASAALLELEIAGRIISEGGGRVSLA